MREACWTSVPEDPDDAKLPLPFSKYEQKELRVLRQVRRKLGWQAEGENPHIAKIKEQRKEDKRKEQ